MAAVSAEVLAWNTGPEEPLAAGVADPLAAGAVGAGDAVVAGAVPGVVMAAPGSERAGLADAPPGDGRGAPEEEGEVPAHPAVRRPASVAAITARTAITGRRGGRAAVRHLTPHRYHAAAGGVWSQTAVTTGPLVMARGQRAALPAFPPALGSVTVRVPR
jgi:hypothetical protein